MGAITECAIGLAEQFLRTVNGALVNLVCSRVYDNVVRRAIRPKSNMDQVLEPEELTDRSRPPQPVVLQVAVQWLS
jgi:hypothetical protein